MVPASRLLLLALLVLPLPALADDYKPDDMISVSFSTEGWVTTATARVVLNVNASVSGANAGSTRDEMMKTVKQLASAEWRLIMFQRNPSETGLENWFAQFEARLPESELNGLNEKAKKASKPGMQIAVGEIDFTPTLAENEAVRNSLRKTLMDKALAELKNIQALFPDRNYRIAQVSFGSPGMGGFAPMDQMAYAAGNARMMKSMAVMDSSESASDGGGVQTAQRMTMTAGVVFAAVAPVAAK